MLQFPQCLSITPKQPGHRIRIQTQRAFCNPTGFTVGSTGCLFERRCTIQPCLGIARTIATVSTCHQRLFGKQGLPAKNRIKTQRRSAQPFDGYLCWHGRHVHGFLFPWGQYHVRIGRASLHVCSNHGLHMENIRFEILAGYHHVQLA